MALRTNQDVTISFKHYGLITIPKGVRLTNQTACGIDEKYNFVDDLSWIKDKYPTISGILTHDAKYYGIDIPKEFVGKDSL